jgi:anti-anti-sigma factor
MIETQVGPDDSILLKPFGDLDWMAAITLRHVVDDALQPGLDLVIDLGQVAHIDAVGISALVGSVRRVRAAGGEAQVSNPCAEVQHRLERAGIGAVLRRSSSPSGGGEVAESDPAAG